MYNYSLSEQYVGVNAPFLWHSIGPKSCDQNCELYIRIIMYIAGSNWSVYHWQERISHSKERHSSTSKSRIGSACNTKYVPMFPRHFLCVWFYIKLHTMYCTVLYCMYYCVMCEWLNHVCLPRHCSTPTGRWSRYLWSPTTTLTCHQTLKHSCDRRRSLPLSPASPLTPSPPPLPSSTISSISGL